MTQKQRTRLGNAVFYIGNTLVALIFVSPLIWMISSSLKPEAGIFKGLNSLRTFIPTGTFPEQLSGGVPKITCGNLSATVCFMSLSLWCWIMFYQLHLRLRAGKV